jgi:hypothetical protein
MNKTKSNREEQLRIGKKIYIDNDIIENFIYIIIYYYRYQESILFNIYKFIVILTNNKTVYQPIFKVMIFNNLTYFFYYFKIQTEMIIIYG